MSDGIAINQSFSRFARSANNNPINLLLSSSLSKVNRNGVQCSGQSVTETGNPFPYSNKITAVASCYIRPSSSSSADYVRRRRLLFSIDALQGQRDYLYRRRLLLLRQTAMTYTIDFEVYAYTHSFYLSHLHDDRERLILQAF
jgi:hypothetical protein